MDKPRGPMLALFVCRCGRRIQAPPSAVVVCRCGKIMGRPGDSEKPPGLFASRVTRGAGAGLSGGE